MDYKILVVMTMVAMIHCEECSHQKLTELNGKITSVDYEHNYNCSWTIVAPEGDRISLQFDLDEFDVRSKFRECDHDYVQVVDNSAASSDRVRTYCKSFKNGFLPPKDAIKSESNVLVVRLISDSFWANGKGFVATYQVIDEFGDPVAPEDDGDSINDEGWDDDTGHDVIDGKFGPIKGQDKNAIDMEKDEKKVVDSKSKDSEKKRGKGKKRRGKKSKKSREEKKRERKLRRQKEKALKRKARKANRKRKSKSRKSKA